MNINLTPAAWIFLGLISVLFIVMNLWLLSAWQNRKKANSDWMTRLRNGVRDPWHEENARLKELRERVTTLRKSQSQEQETFDE